MVGEALRVKMFGNERYRDLALTEMGHELRSNAGPACEESIVESFETPS
jgi:hypothetical protein